MTINQLTRSTAASQASQLAATPYGAIFVESLIVWGFKKSLSGMVDDCKVKFKDGFALRERTFQYR